MTTKGGNTDARVLRKLSDVKRPGSVGAQCRIGNHCNCSKAQCGCQCHGRERRA